MTFPPDFYLIGAQKSGTTTLAYLLSQHPQICVAKSKEPHFFTTNWWKGMTWYKTQFPNYEDAVCIDASTTYSMAPLNLEQNSRSAKQYLHHVPQKLHSINPQAKFIYLLRNPAERVYSAYWHYVTRGRESRSFEEAIKDSFYLDVSNYYGQLVLWLEYFPIDSFLFLLFEDLKENPKQVATKCFKFIGVEDSVFQVTLKEAKNKTKYVNGFGRHFSSLISRLDHSGFGYLAPSSVRNAIHGYTTNNSKNIPKISEQERQYLTTYFSENISKLEPLTGLNLSHWQVQ